MQTPLNNSTLAQIYYALSQTLELHQGMGELSRGELRASLIHLTQYTDLLQTQIGRLEKVLRDVKETQ